MSKRYRKEDRQYTPEELKSAVSAVKQRKLSISAASVDFKVPRKTLDDHVKGKVGEKVGPPSALTAEEETTLVNYMQYMVKRGFPMSRDVVRQYVIAMIKQSQRATTFNLEKGPSDKWFRKFFKKYPNLKEGQPESQDRGRSRMSNSNVMNQYFTLLKDTIDKLKLKPEQIFNCDETGWSGKEKIKQRVIGIKGHHSYQQMSFTPGHVTAHLCICGDGRTLPTFVIFESSLPHTAYKDGVPGNWMFGYSENGYMDSKLFVSWFENIFIPHCGRTRPVLLIMDNHDSHITLDVINLAIKNQVELLGLPPHTTHILQPIDVHINGPLKTKVASVASNLGHINKHQVINKSKFPVVLSYSIDQFCSPARIKDSFRKTGIIPLDPDAIDKTQLTESHSVTNHQPTSTVSCEEPTPSTSAVVPSDIPSSSNSEAAKSICTTCGTFLGGNPLVTEGLIPHHLADIFQAVPCKPLVATSRKLVTKSRVITSADFVKQLTDKMEEEKRKKEDIARRKIEREEKKLKREAEKKEKMKNKKRKGSNKGGQKKQMSRSDQDVYLCKICQLSDPADISDDEDTKWIACEICDDWVHPDCAGLKDVADLESIAFQCQNCFVEE